jgi:Spy/CpxP family protein refolding chaperone
MTRTKTLTLASAVLAAAFAAFAPLQAQQSAPQQGGPPPGRMGHHGPMMAGHWNPPSVDERVQRMSGELNLTPEQTARVKALMTAEQRSADSLRAVHAVQMEAEHKAMEARHTEHEKALLAILTPEQKTKREALMKEHHGPGMRGRGPDGPPDGGHGMRRGPGDEEGTEH